MQKIVIAFIVAFSVSTTASAASKSSAAPPAWVALTKAYPSRNDDVIEKYKHSDDKSTRLYATALLDLAERRFSSLPDDGKACYAAKPGSVADAMAYLACIYAVTTGLGLAQQMKQSYIWRAKLTAFYKRQIHLISKVTGSDNPPNFKGSTHPDVAVIEKWPEQTISVKKNWSAITMHNGTVTAYIDGKPIRMLVDTGTTGIILSEKAVKRNGLKSALVPLGVSLRMLDNSAGYVGHLYYVKDLRVGPITISNAYVSVGPGNNQSSLPRSMIGIGALSALKKFAISASAITPFSFFERNQSTCGHMMFTRHSLMQAVGLPFFNVPTSAASLGLILDSGFHGFDVFRISMYLVPKVKSKLISTGAITPEKKNITLRLLQNGKEVLSRTDIFNISVAGVQTHGLFQRAVIDDPMVAGAMIFNFLKKAKVAYDFPDRKMCVIPDSEPISATSG